MQGGAAAFERKRREAVPHGASYRKAMTYRIEGLDPARFAHLVGQPDEVLADLDVVRVTADSRPGFPCRVSLDDAPVGTTLLLINHVSHEGGNPYRASHAIFVGEESAVAASFRDQVPPALDRRILSLRAFDRGGMMTDAALAHPGEADAVIRCLLADPQTDHIDAHNATRGCFAARIERD